jgi:methylated-DNA-[protein]-cysteine S-methyltransferase
MRHHVIDSPIGRLLLLAEGDALTGLHMEPFGIPPGAPPDAPVLREAEEQLGAYFDGELTEFDLPLAPHGTAFQLRVWDALTRIPYGTTTSYGAVAEAIGRPDAVRAVGACNGQNPIAVIVPCHRVIGSDGSLVGYGGGLDRKRRLLELEAEHTAPRLFHSR